MRTRTLARLALALLLAALAPASPARAGGDGDKKGGDKKPPAKPAEPADDWVTYRDEGEVFEIRLPPGYALETVNRPDRLLTVTYPDDPWKKLRLELTLYPGQKDLKHFSEFVIKRITGFNGPGSHQWVEGSNLTRLISKGDGKTWMSYVGIQIHGTSAFEMHLIAHPGVFEAQKEEYDKILDSFKALDVPKDSYTVPVGWKKVEGDGHVVMGPMGEGADAKTKAAQENRLYELKMWADKGWPSLRALFDDRRKLISRSVIHVLPDEKSYREAAGDAADIAPAMYLPQDAEHSVVVNGTVGGPLDAHALVGALGVQYAETRIGPLPPWLLSALRDYWEAASRRDVPGAVHAERLEEAKSLKGKFPKFGDLRKKDAEGFKALGADGRAAAWAAFEYLLHRADEKTIGAFKAVLRRARDTKSVDKAFSEEKAWLTVFPKDDTRSLDAGLAKWLREEKLEKK